MISDAAMNNLSAEGQAGENAADCPRCGVALTKKGKKKRELQTCEGREVELEREYGTCPECGQGIFPPDGKHPQAQPLTSNLAYLKKREKQIQYPIFQAQGWPIGSGIVESGNKLVVEARLKASGMHWADRHVNPMLAMRNIICSNRWKEEWSKIEAGIRAQKVKKPKAAQPAIISGNEALLLILKEKPEADHPPIDSPFKPNKPKSNPWQNFKFGKSLFQPKYPPKL